MSARAVQRMAVVVAALAPAWALAGEERAAKARAAAGWVAGRSTWLLAALAVAVLAVAAGAVAFALARRRRRAAPGGATVRAAPLRRTRLLRTWKAFLRALPAESRGAIERLQPFVVLGGASSGKSALVAACTDWEGRARQFHPSHTTDPLLQVYVGGGVVVQELSASLLADTSRATRAALRRLWARLRRADAPPQAVVVLDAPSLAGLAPETLREQAQLVRGKLNVLSAAVDRTVQVSLALTRMDAVRGFGPFVELLRRGGIPLDLGLETVTGPSPDPLAPYEAHLGRAVATLSARDFLEVVGFLRDSRPLFAQAGAFLATLRRDSLSRELALGRLCLAARDREATLLSSPFVAAAPDPAAVQRRNPLRRHAVAAVALAAAGLAWLATGYGHERSVREGASATLAELAAARTAPAASRTTDQLLQALARERHGALRRALPRFAPADPVFVQAGLRARFAAALRDGFLAHEVRRTLDLPQERERLVFAAALACAAPTGELAGLVREQPEAWQQVLGLPVPLIAEYVQSSDGAGRCLTGLDPGVLGDRLARDERTVDPGAWAPFFHELEAAQRSAALAPQRLAEIQVRAADVQAVLASADRRALTGRIADALARDGVAAWRTPPALRDEQSQLAQEPLRRFVALLASDGAAASGARPQTLGELLDALKRAGRPAGPEETYAFSLGADVFTFRRSAWSGLVARSRVQQLASDFAATRTQDSGLAFFRVDDRYPPAGGGAANGSFPGAQAQVDGRFTRRAYEEVVRPVLADWAPAVKALGLGDAQQAALSALATAEADAYARRYVEAYRAYYTGFGYAADGETSLRVLLQQLQGPGSPLRALLASVVDNTALAVGSGVEQAPLALVPATFAFVKRIVPSAEGGAPELDRYLSLLALLQRDLESDQPYVARPDVPASALKALLTPLGRVGLAALREEKDAYLDLVDRWLGSVTVPPEWRGPFRGPVVLAAQLGLRQVETTASAAFGDAVGRSLAPLLATFPFDRTATTEPTTAQLEDGLSPKGALARAITDLVDPVLDDARRAGRRTRELAVNVPDATIQLVRQVEAIRPFFWDKAGAPRPLTVSVQPAPLPPWQRGDALVVAYLQVGGQSVLGFNQQPQRKDLVVDWTKPQPASVGVNVQLPEGRPGGSRGLDAPESGFSLYRLLARASPSPDGTFAWRIPDDAGGPGRTVQFVIASDPWAPFNLATSPAAPRTTHETASR